MREPAVAGVNAGSRLVGSPVSAEMRVPPRFAVAADGDSAPGVVAGAHAAITRPPAALIVAIKKLRRVLMASSPYSYKMSRDEKAETTKFGRVQPRPGLLDAAPGNHEACLFWCGVRIKTPHSSHMSRKRVTWSGCGMKPFTLGLKTLMSGP